MKEFKLNREFPKKHVPTDLTGMRVAKALKEYRERMDEEHQKEQEQLEKERKEEALFNEQDLVYRLRKRAEIRRNIPTRKSVQEGKSDRIADILDEAANEIEKLRGPKEVVNPMVSQIRRQELLAQGKKIGRIIKARLAKLLRKPQ